MEEQPVNLPVQLSLYPLSKGHKLSAVDTSYLLSEFSSRSVLFSVGFTSQFQLLQEIFCFPSQEEEVKKSKSTIEVQQGDGD